MPADSDDRILEDHGDRIRRLEDLTIAFGPLVARIDQRLEGIQTDVCEVKADVAAVKSAAVAEVEKNRARDAEIKTLADHAKARKDTIKATLKWVGGIVTAVAIAALTMALGLSK